MNRAGGCLDRKNVADGIVGIGRLIARFIDHLDQPTEIVVDKALTCLAGKWGSKAYQADYGNRKLIEETTKSELVTMKRCN